MAKQDLIGVVTVTYNSADVLPEFLRCAAEQVHQFFLLFVVDNASKDDTLKLLSEWGDNRLRIIANYDNRGVAAGNNQGIVAALEAGCDSVLLLNNDTEFDPFMFAKLSAELAQKRAEMVCPKILYYDEPERIWAAGGTFQSSMGYRSIHIGEGQVDHGQYDKAQLVTYVPTCCVLIQKNVFEKVGLMDERYFVYVDDTDFMYRAMKSCVRLMYLPEATLLHKVGRLTGGENSPFNIRYNTRNRVYYMLKHLGILRSLPLIMLYQLYYILGLLRGRFSLRVYSIKERAVLEGIALWRNSRLTQEGQCQR